MKRLLLLVPLLLTTMGIGPCDPQPLGGVDGGGMPPSGDGGVPPAGDGGISPGRDGGVVGDPGCVYAGVLHLGTQSFPSTDGCNTCSCTMGGGVACTDRACPVRDGGAGPDGPVVCMFNGGGYRAGATFPSPDGCNT